MKEPTIEPTPLLSLPMPIIGMIALPPAFAGLLAVLALNLGFRFAPPQALCFRPPRAQRTGLPFVNNPGQNF